MDSEIKDAIIREMIQAIKRLGAKSDLLGIVCSYGETYEDEFLLKELQDWNSLEHVKPCTERD